MSEVGEGVGDWQFMDDQIHTPEHWSDVGAMRTRVSLLEQQLQMLQAQMSTITGQLTHVSSALQQLDMQFTISRQQQQEDIVKIMATQAMALGNLSAAGPRKARPGPRERQRLREEQKKNESEETSVTAEPSQLAEESLPVEPSQLAEKSLPVAACRVMPTVETLTCMADMYQELRVEESLPDVPGALSSKSRFSHWACRCLAFLAWLLYSQSDMVSTSLAARFSNDAFADESDAETFRELGHLRLSMSDCAGAEIMFALAANSSTNAKKARALSLERGFALVCSQRFQDGAELLSQGMLEGGLLSSSPAYLVNALAYAYFRLREFHKAKEVLESVVQANPQNPLLWNNLGAASMSLGDITTADDALYYAISQTSKLQGSSSAYYTQLVSNNIHAFRKRSMGEDGPAPAMELFNCIEKELRSKVSSASQDEFKKIYAKAHVTDEPGGTENLLASRQAALALEREYLLCP